MSEHYTISPDMSALLEALYRGPLEANLFNGFLMAMREALGANFATLILRLPKQGDTGLVLNAVILPEAERAYLETYFALDPFVDLPTSGAVFTLAEFMPEEALKESVYFQEYMQPVNVHQIIGTDIVEPGGFKARFRATRPEGAPEFGAVEKALIAQLQPHLRQALTLHSKLQNLTTERAIYAGAVDHFEVGSIILDETGRVRSVNQAAQEILSTKCGLQLQDGFLQVGSRLQNAQFKRLMDDVMSAHLQRTPSFARAFRLEREYGRAALGLVIRPAPVGGSAEDPNVPCVAIFISDPERELGTSSSALIQLFGFTPAEANLSLLLANGLTLDEASDKLNISRNTAKSHLSAIFAKTGVTRQTKLVQLILKSVAPMA